MSLKLNERYPGRFTNPSIDYPQGQFKNRTTPTAKDGSYLEQDWANDKEGLFQSLLKVAGVTANGLVDKVGASQYFDAMISIAQAQFGKAYTATVVSAGLHSITPSPAITVYSANQRFQVVFQADSNGVDLLRVSGLSYRGIKQYDVTGTKSVASFKAGQICDAVYDGTDFVLLGQNSPLTLTAPQVQAQTYTAYTAAPTAAGFHDITPTPSIAAYAANQRFQVTFSQASNGSDALRVSNIGYKAIKQYNSLGIKSVATFSSGQKADLVYDGTDFVILNPLPATVSNVPPSGYLSGFLLANNATTPNTNIDVGSGAAADSTGTYLLSLSSTMIGILQSSGSWAAGTGANKLDSGSRALSTWYHAFVIRKTSDGSTDILFSLSATAPTMPTGYSGFRRVGSFKTSSGGPILLFSMVALSGRRMTSWITPIMDVSQATLGTTAVSYTISTPPGVRVLARLNTFSYANNSMVYFSDPITANLAPANSSGYPGFTCGYGAITDSSTDSLGTQLTIMTSNSSQINASANAASNTVSILTLGWEE